MTKMSKVLLIAVLMLAFELTLGSAPLPAANQVHVACPVIQPAIVVGDSVAIPIHITNDVDMSGFSLGFHYNSDAVEITSISLAGSVIPAGAQSFIQKKFVPADNKVLIGWVDFTTVMPIAPQVDGLAFTLNMKILPGATWQCIDFDSSYVPPAGPFIFSPSVGDKITPAYVDCGASDIIIGGSECPSSNTAPVVSDIPGQTIAEGGSFATISLDNYVADAESPDNALTWTASSASPNSFAVAINPSTHVATITYPGGQFNGNALFTFTATDPGGLSGSDTARFVVTPVNDPPVVAGIPDQNLPYGSTFATITLDNYVTDPDNTPAQMTWTYSGNSQLTVSINASRVATISKPSADWSGSESIIFTATDPGALFDSDTAIFSIAAPSPLIEITPDTLNFSAYAGGSNPLGQGAMITNSGNGTLDWSASENTAWFSITSASGTAPSGFTVNVDITGLAIGSYVGDVTVTSAQAGNSPQVLKVILTVLNPVDIKLNPDSLFFHAHLGDPNPIGQNVSITNGIPSGIEFGWAAVETSPWLSLTATTGNTPSDVTVNVDMTGLSVGTYNTTIEIAQTAAQLSAGVIGDKDTVYVQFVVDQPTGVNDGNGALPSTFSLEQNFPNPFNPETVIEYNLAASGRVTLTVFNVLGQKVVDVVNEYQTAGHKQATWNGRDQSGREVQSGVYFYRLTTDTFSMTRKMMLLK